MKIKTYNDIYEDMRSYLAAQMKVEATDFNHGGVLSSMLEAFARELEMAYIFSRVGFTSFLRQLPYSVFGFKPLAGKKASVFLKFFAVGECENKIIIPKGTKVSGGGLVFETTNEGVIPVGNNGNTASISAIAESTGSKYNLPANVINTINADDKNTIEAGYQKSDEVPAGGNLMPPHPGTAPEPEGEEEDENDSPLAAQKFVITVCNSAPAMGGEDTEPRADFIARFADYIIGLQGTNLSGIKNALMSDGLIRSMSIQEHFMPEVPPASAERHYYNMTLYLEDGSGGMANDDIQKAIQVVEKHRAPGIKIRYLQPSIVHIKIVITVTVNRDYSSEVADTYVIEKTQETVAAHINNLRIGEAVCASDLIVRLKDMPILEDAHISGMYKKSGSEENKDDIKINFDEIARIAINEINNPGTPNAQEDCKIIVEYMDGAEHE
jgi:hypothetical protein